MSHTEAAAGSKARVVEVWAHNAEAELARSTDLIRDFPVAVVATSQDVPSRPVPAPPTRARRLRADADGFYHITGPAFRCNMDYNCERIYARVRGTRFLQIAMALFNRGGDLALGRVWRLHPGAPSASDERFMVELGVEPSVRRVDCARFANALRTVWPPDVTWVTSDGAEDMAQLAECMCNPKRIYPAYNNADHHTLIQMIRAHFLNLYDLRFLAEWRTLAGEEPPLFRSPDTALFRSFLTLMREPTFAERMGEYKGLLSGLGHWDTSDLDQSWLSIEEQERLYKEALAELNGDEYDLEHVHMHALIQSHINFSPIRLMTHLLSNP